MAFLKSRFKRVRIVYYCVLFVALLACCSYIQSYDKEIIPFFEAYLSMIQNRFALNTVFTLPVVLSVIQIFEIKDYEYQVIFRVGGIQKWFLRNTVFMIIYIFSFFILLFLLSASLSGVMGYNLSNQLSSNIYNYSLFDSINSIDDSGAPLSVIIYLSDNAVVCIVVAIVLLFFRAIFWVLLCLLIYCITTRFNISIMITILLSYIDVFFYVLFPNIKHKWILPHENSVITAICGERIDYMVSFIYWGVVVAVLLIINIGIIQNAYKKNMLSISNVRE